MSHPDVTLWENEWQKTGSESFSFWQPPQMYHPQMMAYVIRTINGQVIVIDGGWSEDAQYLREMISQLGGDVTAWFITHAHRDHMDALKEILLHPGKINIDTIYASFLSDDWMKQNSTELEYDGYLGFMQALWNVNREMVELELGQEIVIDGTCFEVLGIKNPEIIINSINNSSVVLRVWDRVKSILFLSDLGLEGGEKLLLSSYASRLPSDFVQMAHHGQNGVGKEVYQVISANCCLWPTPNWLYHNDDGDGPGTGPWKTQEVRGWMKELQVKANYISYEGLAHIIDKI